MPFPILINDFLNRDEVNYLLQYSQNSQELYNSHQSSCEFWNKRCIYFHSIPNKKVQDLVFELTIEMREIIKSHSIISTNLYAEYPQFVKWEPGWELTPHCDNCEPDGITPNATAWRSHCAVIYLNCDFDGGEILYPKLDLEIRPKPGMMVIHPAGLEYLHGIKKVTKGIRHTISIFFTYQSTALNLISEEAEKSLTEFFI